MNRRWIYGGLLLFSLACRFALWPVADEETVRVMPFVADGSACRECHPPARPGLPDPPAAACDAMCARCHGRMADHHRTGMAVPDLPAGPTRLTSGGKLACISCHDLNRPARDSVSWRSESLFGRLFRRPSRFKTYYLVVRNNRGQLCKRCH